MTVTLDTVERTKMEIENQGDLTIQTATCVNDVPLATKLACTGLYSDIRAIFLAYPNLERSVNLLGEYIGTQWPMESDTEKSAVLTAVETAVSEYKAGIVRGELDDKFTTVNFLNGLLTITQDIVAFNVIGMNGTSDVTIFDPFTMKFSEWVKSPKMNKVVFAKSNLVSRVQYKGMVWKIRTAIASTRDLGWIHLYGDR